MSRSLRFSFAAHPTVGHTQALRTIASELTRRGHLVDFATSRVPRLPPLLPVPEPLRAARRVVTSLEADGFEVIRTPFSLPSGWAASRLAVTRGYDELGWATDLFTRDALKAARVLIVSMRRRRVDLVVHDFTFFGAWLAADALGLPSAAVFHSGLPFPAPGQPPFGSGLGPDATRGEWARASHRLERIAARVDRRIARARGALGLPNVERGVLTRPYSTGLNVLTSFEAFELPRPDLARRAAGPILWAGPCVGARAEALDDFPWERLQGDGPLVYVSLGTVFNDQPDVYRALLEGVHRAGARAVVAAGASLERVRRIAEPSDVVVGFAPQLALLERADLVIGHGGNNTVNECLRAGTPSLVLPFGAEQTANAQRVEALGVGRRLRADALSATTVASMLERALAGPMGGRARELRERIPSRDGAPLVADALERLAAETKTAGH